MKLINKIKDFFIIEKVETKIPVNLSEAITALNNYFSDLEKVSIFQSTESTESIAINYHRTIGMTIRNDWGLWYNSELSRYIQDNHGIYHPDDMSNFIICSYIRNIKGE